MLKNTKAYSRRNRICLHGLVSSGTVSMGAGKIWGRREEGSVRIDTRKNRFHEQRVFPASSSPQVRCNRWKEGARAMLREEDSACCTCMQRGRKPSIGIHRTAAEFHLYANSKPRCDPCFHLEIPARRVDPISRFHGTTYHPLPTTRRVRAPTNNWSILVFLSVGDSEQLIEFGRIRTNGFAFESYESSSPRQDNFRQRRRSTIVDTIYEYTISSPFESLLIIIERARSLEDGAARDNLNRSA